jgi:hypothetical protein
MYVYALRQVHYPKYVQFSCTSTNICTVDVAARWCKMAGSKVYVFRENIKAAG